jgi:hypothetical protein
MKLKHLAVMVVVVAGAQAAPAQAQTRMLSATGTSSAACHATWRAGEPGVVTTSFAVPAASAYTATLTAASGDWDLAVFDADRRPVTGGASPGAREIADGLTVAAGDVLVQACRRSGADRATIAFAHEALPDERPQGEVKIVEVATPTAADKRRLQALGFDLTEHGHAGGLGVVLHGDADERRLREAGFDYHVEVPDLAARTLRDRAADARFARATRRSALPSGRDVYRTLADYETELKTLAAQNPGLVKLVELPHKTWMGRTVLGVEITTNVNVADGKPAFLNMGVHHAREWPSGEHAMEWAYELINGYKAGDPRATRIVEQSRNIVVPIVNPDGFNASRTAGALAGQDGGRDEAVPDTIYILGGVLTGGEYRRKNCRLPGTELGNCLTSAGLAETGVDPNRNYGAFWGGPGADQQNLTAQTYPGPAPFSEPESRNIRDLVARNQVTTLITNHTTAGLVLRAPGLASLGDPVDEPIYKALGDAMARENGYFSQKSFELYDTTGTTEDWSYSATGGLGFTFEIYCGAPNYSTGDCDDPAFHPTFATMVKEWDGTSPQADHAGDPAGPYDGKGNREAYYLAAESTLNEARHSVLTGEVPSGVTLRLKKEFKTETFPQASNGDKPIAFDDKLESTYEVGADGKVRWHVNPSTRPIVAKARGKENGGTPSAPIEVTGTAANPAPQMSRDIPFTVPAGGDNESAEVAVTWTSPLSDYDLVLFSDTNGNGAVDGGEPQVAASEQGLTQAEAVTLTRAALAAGAKYVARVTNYAAAEPYTLRVTFAGPEPFQPARTEAYTLTCELGGQVLETQQVVVARGETKPLGLTVCATKVAQLRGQTPPPVAPSAPSRSVCVAGGGFGSAGAKGARGGRVALAFSRKVTRPVSVDVFQQSVGRRVIGERLVARFTGKAAGFTWDGKANRRGRKVTDGFYFARYTIARPGGGSDVRRVTLRRANGRWSTRPGFYRPDSCGVVRSYKLTRPVFGGPGARPIQASYRLGAPGRVTLEVLRGTKVVKRFAAAPRRADVTYRTSLAAKTLARGDHRFRLTVVSGGKTTRVTLTSRRL